MMRELYQKLYEDPGLHYGDASHDRCPGVRYLPIYRHWLQSPIIDLGCGRGDAVLAMRREGLIADGVDQVDLANGMMVNSITQPWDLSWYRTATCIDVFEHLLDDDLRLVMANMMQCERQVISVYSEPAKERGYDQELHVNLKGLDDWYGLVSAHFDVVERVRVARMREIYLTRTK